MNCLRLQPSLFAPLVLTLCLGVSRASAAIVDTLSAFDSERDGWTSSMKLGFSAKGGNTELLEFSSAAQLQWQGSRDRLRALGGYARQTSESREIAEDALLHLRHNRRILGAAHSLLFVQAQRNPFQRLESRTLFGLGGRFDLFESDRGSVSIGAAHMVEIERIDGEAEGDAVQRLSTFLFARLQLTEMSNVRTAFYLQPLWEEFGDLRASGSLALEVALTKQLSLEVGGTFQHDSRPPSAVDETDWSTSSSLKFRI